LANLDLLLALDLTANPAKLRCLWKGPNGGGGENRQVQMLLLFLQASSHRSSSPMVWRLQCCRLQIKQLCKHHWTFQWSEVFNAADCK
jgi:hypothetical protein